MSLYTRVPRAEFKEIRALAAGRKAKRLERVADNAALASKSTGNGPRLRRKALPRRLAFNRLKTMCREYVLRRNVALRNGMCEIAMSCGGENHANTWYHGWPQKGGNGIKYDVRSHFASCGPCNMGEYGARMAGSKMYENRHKEIIGEPLWSELNALHGRRQISTKEADAITADLKSRIERGDFSL